MRARISKAGKARENEHDKKNLLDRINKLQNQLDIERSNGGGGGDKTTMMAKLLQIALDKELACYEAIQ